MRVRRRTVPWLVAVARLAGLVPIALVMSSMALVLAGLATLVVVALAALETLRATEPQVADEAVLEP